MPSRPCVLLVDDQEENRAVYAALLAHHGYRVLVAQDGREAVQLARAASPDVILMDISMPVMDGWDARKALAASPETSGIPVIALTADDGPQPRKRAERAGFHLLLPKPCDGARLLHEVRQLAGPGVAAGG